MKRRVEFSQPYLQTMKSLLLIFIVVVTLSRVAIFAALPEFESDISSDQWLRKNSDYYRMMATEVEHKPGYSFTHSSQIVGGNVKMDAGKLVIELSDSISGAKRLSILIFEMTNCYQHFQHKEIDEAAASGRITSAREFGMLHELVELDGLRHHRLVLEDLDRELKGIPAEMLQWINPKLQRLSDYNLPFAYDHIKAQETGGHTKHYHDWFPKQAKPGNR